MISATIAITLSLLSTDPVVDSQTIAEVFRSYTTDFRDVQFLYEGKLRMLPLNNSETSTFQGSYTFREDGATLIDLFMFDGQKPNTRLLWSLVNEKKENFEASPDIFPPLNQREPSFSGGAPGSLNMPYSPERFFLAYFFRSHTNPDEFLLGPEGWEEIDGRRCIIVRAYDSPRPKSGTKNIKRSFIKLWLDLERNGHPLRIMRYEDDKIVMRTSITLQQLIHPKGRLIWFPLQAETYSYGVIPTSGKLLRKTEPDFLETCKILPGTIHFDQLLGDAFFSTKQHALVTSNETLAQLKRSLESTIPPAKIIDSSDPASLKRKMDDALLRADAQSQRLEASSVARSSGGWFSTALFRVSVLGIVFLIGFLLYRLKVSR